MKHGHSRRGHVTKEYRAYWAMYSRCYRPKNKEYHRYGGRGIRMTKAWLGRDGFIQFLADMGSSPSPMSSIDRINNNQNYSPRNCRWATITEQVRNRRNTVKYNDIPLAEWAAMIGIKPHTLACRWRAGDRDKYLLRPLTPRSGRNRIVDRATGEPIRQGR